MSKLWGGRFTKETDRLVEEYTSSISFDQRLAKQDIVGSMAHAQMLGECGIISTEEADLLIKGLKTLLAKLEQNQLQFAVQDEDIHMNIERLLHQEIGAVAGKLHTARSRNDQVAVDMHLYLREVTDEFVALIRHNQDCLVRKAAEHVETIMPGYTHLQRAQAVSLGHHLMAYFWMLERDKQRFRESRKRVNVLPLGAGALAGTTFPIDPERSARLLEFAGCYPNSMDAVSDRDFIVEFLANSSILMMHISRLAEEMVIWSSQEFAFIELDDAYSTGSSIMPQKKNPDVPELLRGKTGRVYGNLMGLLTVLKGLPLAYNKDLQEDKEGMFDTADTLKGALRLLAPMIDSLRINAERMRQAVQQDFSNATDLADYLAKKGVPFREAHAITGRIVLYAITKQKFLLDLSLAEYQEFSDLIDEDIYEILQPERVVGKRCSLGGTAPSRVREQIAAARKLLED